MSRILMPSRYARTRSDSPRNKRWIWDDLTAYYPFFAFPPQDGVCPNLADQRTDKVEIVTASGFPAKVVTRIGQGWETNSVDPEVNLKHDAPPSEATILWLGEILTAPNEGAGTTLYSRSHPTLTNRYISVQYRGTSYGVSGEQGMACVTRNNGNQYSAAYGPNTGSKIGLHCVVGSTESEGGESSGVSWNGKPAQIVGTDGIADGTLSLASVGYFDYAGNAYYHNTGLAHLVVMEWGNIVHFKKTPLLSNPDWLVDAITRPVRLGWVRTLEPVSEEVTGPQGLTGVGSLVTVAAGAGSLSGTGSAGLTGSGSPVTVAAGSGTASTGGQFLTGSGSPVTVGAGAGTLNGTGSAPLAGQGSAVAVAAGAGSLDGTGTASLAGAGSPVTVTAGAGGLAAGGASLAGAGSPVNVAAGAGGLAATGSASLQGSGAPVSVEAGLGALVGSGGVALPGSGSGVTVGAGAGGLAAGGVSLVGAGALVQVAGGSGALTGTGNANLSGQGALVTVAVGRGGISGGDVLSYATHRLLGVVRLVELRGITGRSTITGKVTS